MLALNVLQTIINQTKDKNSAVKCPEGLFQPDIGKAECQQCPSGTYGEKDTGICKDCPVGYLSAPNREREHVLYCNYGTFQNSTGKASCYECNPGQYQNILASDQL